MEGKKWTVGEVARERSQLTESLQARGANMRFDGESMSKFAGAALAGSAFAMMGMISLAAIGASGGLAAPLVAVGMQALFGASAGMLLGAGLFKQSSHMSNQKAYAFESAVGQLERGRFMDVVIDDLAKGTMNVKGLGAKLVDKLASRRMAAAERDMAQPKAPKV